MVVGVGRDRSDGCDHVIGIYSVNLLKTLLHILLLFKADYLRILSSLKL